MTRLLSTKEVAEILNVRPGTVQDYCERREIPFYKLGSKLRFKKEEVERWLEQKRVEIRPRWPVSHRKRA